MDTENQLPKKKPRKLDRITLGPISLERVDTWLSAANSNTVGCTLSRSDIVNWIITNHKTDLSSKELKAVAETFSDETKRAKWACEEVIAAKKRGESLTLEEVLKRQKQSLRHLAANKIGLKGRRKSAKSSAENSSESLLEKADTTNNQTEFSFQKT